MTATTKEAALVGGGWKAWPGTTTTVMLRRGSHACVAWVGDSPAYHYRRGVASKLVAEHNQGQLLAAIGEISKDKVTLEGGDLSRAIGKTADVKVSVTSVGGLQLGDAIVLGSDGLQQLRRWWHRNSSVAVGKALKRALKSAGRQAGPVDLNDVARTLAAAASKLGKHGLRRGRGKRPSDDVALKLVGFGNPYVGSSDHREAGAPRARWHVQQEQLDDGLSLDRKGEAIVFDYNAAVDITLAGPEQGRVRLLYEHPRGRPDRRVWYLVNPRNYAIYETLVPGVPRTLGRNHSGPFSFKDGVSGDHLIIEIDALDGDVTIRQLGKNRTEIKTARNY